MIDLLDDKDFLLQREGAHIIAHLSFRYVDLVTKHILDPIRLPLLPSEKLVGKAECVVTSDELVETTLKRLLTITSIPSPTLIATTLKPLLRNLFVLAAYTGSTPHAHIKAQVIQVLEKYTSSASSDDVLSLLDLLLSTSFSERWTYTAGGHGGVAIRRLSDNDSRELGLDEITARISVIIEVLSTAPESVKSRTFVRIIRQWLSLNDEKPLEYGSR